VRGAGVSIDARREKIGSMERKGAPVAIFIILSRKPRTDRARGKE